jgi:DNA ligase-1
MKMVHRKSNIEAEDAVLHLFDIIPLKDFLKGQCKTTQEARSVSLDIWKSMWEKETPSVEIVGQELVDLDTDVGMIRYKEINKQAVDGGYEGVMLKNPQGIYECKRSANWLKSKPFISVSLKITWLEAGTGKNVGRLGALVCEGMDDGKMIKVNVGSGFTDQQRVEFWSTDILGHIVEVRADAVTQNQDGTYSLRFPRFIGFRGFSPGEKI